jgi:aspartyl-tRNA(Asn)/glutamyl-tRNA(Gln) amidotransferase subunit A
MPVTASADLLFRPITETARLLRAKRLSPVALVEASLERLDGAGRRLNAVVTLAGSEALDAARDAEKDFLRGKSRGPLHGIPWGAKDLLATRGMPTTWGAEPFRQQRIDEDATVVRRLRDAGAILTAKLAMVELAGGMGYNNADASFTGPGLNPWNREHWSGGSSSGPGSAVAAGLVSFAIGSETVGSILTPSAYSGVTGLRPTYGRVSRHGAMALSWTLDKLGPMARSAEDCALVLKAIEGADPRDASSVFVAPSPRKTAGARRLRVGVLRSAAERAQAEVAKNFQDAVAQFERFAHVTADVVLPDFPYGLCTGAIVAAEGASAFSDLIEAGRLKELRARADRVGGYSNSMMPAVDYVQAMRLREKMREPFQALFERYDVLVAPTRDTVANPIGIDFDKSFPEVYRDRPRDFVSPIGALISAGNLLGYPALSLPDGFGQDGLPTGIQLLAGPFREDHLVALGAEYQRRTTFHTKRPPEVGG